VHAGWGPVDPGQGDLPGLTAFRLPLLFPAVGWTAGLAAARTDWVSWPVLAWVTGITAVFLFGHKTRQYAIVLLAGIAWGAINLAWDAHSVAFHRDWLEGTQKITARVIETRQTSAYTRLTLDRIHRSRRRNYNNELRGKAWLYIYQHAANKVRAGDSIQARVHWHTPRNHNNPGGFDFETYCFDRHIALVGSIRGQIKILVSDATWMERMRQRIRKALNDLPDSQGGILAALLLADRSHIPIRIQDVFSATGAMHLLAISGLHVGMAGAIGFGLCWWLLTRREAWIIRFPVRGVALVSGMLAAMAYASLAGWPLPTQRAAMMLAAGVLAWWIKARTVPVNILLAALILILTVDTQAVGSISLWLSFIATAAILLWAGKYSSRQEGFDIPHVFTGMLWVTLIAGLATLPLIAHIFGRLPIYSLPANIVMTPLYSFLVLPLALMGVTCAGAGFGGVATELFSRAGYGIDIGNRLLAWMVEWPGGHLWIPSVSWGFTGLYVSGAMFSALLWRSRRPVALAVMTATVLIYGMAVVQERPPAQARLIAWDVGQGAAASLVLPDGRVMVVDAPGRGGSRFNGGTIVAAGLRASGFTHVDVLVVTHAQSDHMGGMMRLMDQVNHVGQLWLADVPDVKRHPDIQRLIQRVRMQGGAVHWLKQGDNIRFGSVQGTLLWPPAGYHPVNPNNASLVLSLQLENGKRLLFPGDIEAEGESRMLAHGLTPYDLMLMPHHGSTTSSTLAFVHAAMPGVVIAQTGYANRYGFPKSQVVRRYEQTGARIWDTSHGAVIVTARDKGDIHTVYAAPVRSEKRYRALQWWRHFYDALVKSPVTSLRGT